MLLKIERILILEGVHCRESMESLRDRGDAAHDEDDRNVADLLLDQIEFANVIILNKIDLVQEDEKQKMLALLRALNPVANILESVNSEVPLHEVVATKLFSFEDAARSAGWLQVRFHSISIVFLLCFNQCC